MNRAKDQLGMSVTEFLTSHAEDKKEVYNPSGEATSPLGGRTLKTSEAEGEKDKYYYLVVQYPNSKDQTTNDLGKTIQVSLNIDENSINIAEEGPAA